MGPGVDSQLAYPYYQWFSYFSASYSTTTPTLIITAPLRTACKMPSEYSLGRPNGLGFAHERKVTKPYAHCCAAIDPEPPSGPPRGTPSTSPDCAWASAFRTAPRPSEHTFLPCWPFPARRSPHEPILHQKSLLHHSPYWSPFPPPQWFLTPPLTGEVCRRG